IYLESLLLMVALMLASKPRKILLLRRFVVLSAPDPLDLYYDNSGGITLAKEPISYQKFKHRLQGDVNIYKVHTRVQSIIAYVILWGNNDFIDQHMYWLMIMDIKSIMWTHDNGNDPSFWYSIEKEIEYARS
ncbi:hypothetical protein ACJX0J_010024, partial [Zea mays]